MDDLAGVADVPLGEEEAELEGEGEAEAGRVLPSAFAWFDIDKEVS